MGLGAWKVSSLAGPLDLGVGLFARPARALLAQFAFQGFVRASLARVFGAIAEAFVKGE